MYIDRVYISLGHTIAHGVFDYRGMHDVVHLPRSAVSRRHCRSTVNAETNAVRPSFSYGQQYLSCCSGIIEALSQATVKPHRRINP